jgi:hypothetical protein
MSANVQIPAITAAIHDAIGVWVTQFPATPEMIFKALRSKKSAAGLIERRFFQECGT